MIDELLAHLPPAEVLRSCAAMAGVAAVLLAAAMGPFLVLAGDRLAVTRKRGFYAKAALQVSQMGIVTGIAACALLAAGGWWMYSINPTLLAPPFDLPVYAATGTVTAALLLIAVAAVAQSAKGRNGLKALFALLAGCAGVLGTILVTGLLRRLLHTPPSVEPGRSVPEQLLDFFSIPPDSLLWPLLAQGAALGLAFAAALATLWMLVMRERQDFGRDYYAFALPFCARWAAGSTLAAVALGAFALYRSGEIMLPELSHYPSLALVCLSAGLPLLACGLWLSIVRSQFPLRRKISTVVALLFLWTGFAGQVLMLYKIIPSP